MEFKWNSGTEQVVGALWPRSNRASNYKSGVGYIDTFLNEIKTKHLPVTFIMNTAASDILMNLQVVKRSLKAQKRSRHFS